MEACPTSFGDLLALLTLASAILDVPLITTTWALRLLGRKKIVPGRRTSLLFISLLLFSVAVSIDLLVVGWFFHIAESTFHFNYGKPDDHLDALLTLAICAAFAKFFSAILAFCGKGPGKWALRAGSVFLLLIAAAGLAWLADLNAYLAQNGCGSISF